MIRILLVDDQKTVRESLRSWLEPVRDFKIVGTACDGHSAIEQVEILEPDVVLIDLEMPALDGVETTAIICQKFIGVKVIVLSMHDGNKYVSHSLQAGAVGYLLKNTPKHELIEAITFVNRGYSQFAPGILNRMIASMPSSPTTSVQESEVNDHDLDYVQLTNAAESYSSSSSPQLPFPTKPRSKKFYLKVWLFGNLFIWLLSFAYLQFRQPSYASKWAIALPASNSFTSIDIPGVGQASSESESPYNSDFADPRENYKYLAKTEEVLATAAKSLGMTSKEFGKPQVEIPGNTTLIEFRIDGQQPKIAQMKAIALQESLRESLKRLRKDESSERSQDLENTLTVANEKLAAARQKLAKFKIDSGLSSPEQTSGLTQNIEQLRRQQAEIKAQEQKVSSRFNQLQNNLKISTSAAAEALILQSDQQLKEYLDNFSQVSRELANLTAKFSANHPSVINKRAEKEQTQTELYRRGEFLLGKPITLADLKNVNADTSSGISQRSNLYQELISLQAEKQALADQATTLNQQISSLEAKLSKMSQSASTLQQLNNEVQLAQAVSSSTATKLELSRSQTSASYPPISVVSRPSLPSGAASPRKELVVLGSIFSSILLTTALLSLWSKNKLAAESQIPQLPGSEDTDGSSNGRGHYSLPPLAKFNGNSVKK